MSDSAMLVQKLWNYCSVLRDDGLSYQDYIEQLTFLLFLKMADELVVRLEGDVGGDPEPRQVEPDGALLGMVGVEVDHHQEHVVARLVHPADAEHAVVPDLLDAQCRQQRDRATVAMPELVEPGDVRRQAVRAGPIARPELVLLGVGVLLTARLGSHPLTELVAAVHAPGGSRHRRQGRAHPEGRRSPLLEVG